jgi:DtxR family transcriptional regulator, Mn-dependent transcriptional regulator
MTTNSGTKKLQLTASMEDYLEAIAELQREKKVVRVRDIAKRLAVRMPSVTGALKNLADKGLILHEKYEYVELTREGQKQADRVRERHVTLRTFLNEILGLDSKVAEADACCMEHAISNDTQERLVKFIDFTRACTEGGDLWLESFQEYFTTGSCPRITPVAKEKAN